MIYELNNDCSSTRKLCQSGKDTLGSFKLWLKGVQFATHSCTLWGCFSFSFSFFVNWKSKSYQNNYSSSCCRSNLLLGDLQHKLMEVLTISLHYKKGGGLIYSMSSETMYFSSTFSSGKEEDDINQMKGPHPQGRESWNPNQAEVNGSSTQDLF